MSDPGDVPTLTDDRISLRPLTRADAPGMLELLSDPVSIAYIDGPLPTTIAAAEEFIDDLRAGRSAGIRRWAIEVRGTAAFAGFAALHGTGPVRAAGVSIHPAHRGQRVATDAVRLVIDWAFESEGARTITWHTQAGHYASWRVAWSLGFTFDGKLRQALEHNGETRDVWGATLLADDDREPKTTWMHSVRMEHVGVVLRALTAADKDRFLETLNDPESMLWLGTIPMPRTPEAFDRFLDRHLMSATLGDVVGWTVADPDTDEYLGTITLFGFKSLDYKSAEVGYRTHPSARGRGVLTSGLRAVINHAFTPEDEGGLGVERISLLAGEGNLPSLGVARSCGFTETGRDRHCYNLDDGRVVDLIRFDLLKSEWDAAD